MSRAITQSPVLEPRQERSRATRRKILNATNRLLRSQSFESFSVQEIATGAECSIGAFYGRFRGKDDLLEPLFERHTRGIERWLNRAVASPEWRGFELQERLEWIVRMDARVLRSRRWLIRALAVYLRRDGAQMTDAQRRRRQMFTDRTRELLLDFADQFRHDDARSAIDFALFLIATLCRERVLFGELSDQAWVAEGDEALVREVSKAALLYLTGSGLSAARRMPS